MGVGRNRCFAPKISGGSIRLKVLFFLSFFDRTAYITYGFRFSLLVALIAPREGPDPRRPPRVSLRIITILTDGLFEILDRTNAGSVLLASGFPPTTP